MPISRPSRVGAPSPSDPYYPLYDRDILEERISVDRRLEQLERAREKAAASLPRRRKEKFEQKWDDLRRYFHLSRRQELLYRSVDGIATSIQDAIRIVYGVKWERLSKRQRDKYLGRLRTLQHAINAKLEAGNDRNRIEIYRGKLRLVSRREWKKPRAVRRRQKTKTLSPRKKNKRRVMVSRCVKFLRFLLAEKYKSSIPDGWRPVAMLNGEAKREGFETRTIRTARKHLNLETKKAKGFGGKGGWMVRLPVEKEAKT